MRTVIHILCLFAAGVLGAFVLVQLWAWFMLPLGVPAIGVAHAYGIGVIATFLTYVYRGTTIETQQTGKT